MSMILISTRNSDMLLLRGLIELSTSTPIESQCYHPIKGLSCLEVLLGTGSDFVLERLRLNQSVSRVERIQGDLRSKSLISELQRKKVRG